MCLFAFESSADFAGTNQGHKLVICHKESDVRDVLGYQRCPCETDRWEIWCMSIKPDVWHEKWKSWLASQTDISTNASFQCSRLRENTGWEAGSRASRRGRDDGGRELCVQQPAAELSLWLLGAVPSGKGLLLWHFFRNRALFFPEVLVLIAF